MGTLTSRQQILNAAINHYFNENGEEAPRPNEDLSEVIDIEGRDAWSAVLHNANGVLAAFTVTRHTDGRLWCEMPDGQEPLEF
jgi:hypothetical protein